MLKTSIVIICIIQFSSSNLFDAACHGRLQQTPKQQRALRCRYANNEVPYCRLAPFKLEVLSLDPYVALYHEVIYDREIQYVLAASRHTLQRSTVRTAGVATTSDMRTSRHTWIYGRHKFLQSLEARLVDMTGLSLKTAEYLQVVNYKIGEFYGLHHDFVKNATGYWFEGKGNRMLTALFYLNDVDLGGATVFPRLRLFVPPIRRGMIMWHNLHKSLEFDQRTEHGGCAVKNGTKWILTEWFHAVEQVFRRPCDLKADHLNFL